MRNQTACSHPNSPLPQRLTAQRGNWLQWFLFAAGLLLANGISLWHLSWIDL